MPTVSMRYKDFYEARYEYNGGLFEYGPYKEFDASVARNRAELDRRNQIRDWIVKNSAKEDILEVMEVDKNKWPPYRLETFTY